MKSIIKSLTPPLFLQICNKLIGGDIQWIGEYQTWEEASSQTQNYNPELYLSQLINALKIVKNDESKCERDSILFDSITYPYALLSNLFAITTYFQSQSLFILDFGGSLGSTYFQNRKFLRLLPSYTWNILEQPIIIQAGKEHFQTQQLLFHSTINEAKIHIKAQDTKILLLSSVLQYLKDPYSTLKSLIENFHFDAILIDRTPFSKDDSHHIVIQKVPKNIYQAQYPCHLLSKKELLEQLVRGGGYQLLDEFESYCDAHTSRFDSLGFSFFKEK